MRKYLQNKRDMEEQHQKKMPAVEKLKWSLNACSSNINMFTFKHSFDQINPHYNLIKDL